MPKILPNIKSRMIAEAKKIIVKDGLDSFTIVDIARICDISVGTAYKHFKSPSALTSEVMFTDWCKTIKRVVKIADTCTSIVDGYEKIYAELKVYAKEYDVPLSSYSDGMGNYVLPTEHHNYFVKQFRDILSDIFVRLERADLVKDANLCAEILLASVSRSDITVRSMKDIVNKL